MGGLMLKDFYPIKKQLLIMGVVAVIVFGVPGSGMFAIGAGLILLALGILFVAFCVWLCTRVLPLLIRAVVSFCRGLFGKGGRKE